MKSCESWTEIAKPDLIPLLRQEQVRGLQIPVQDVQTFVPFYSENNEGKVVSELTPVLDYMSGGSSTVDLLSQPRTSEFSTKSTNTQSSLSGILFNGILASQPKSTV